MNQALAFGLLLAGGVTLEAGLTGKGPGAVLQGKAGAVPTTGTTLSVAGAGTAIANTAAPTAADVNAATNPGGSGLVASGQKIIATISNAMGWGAAGASAWEGVEGHEDSSYSLTATNPTSGAYGEAQGITGPSWYAAHGGDASTQTGQLTAMGNYIKQRYGTPENALAHENAFGWY